MDQNVSLVYVTVIPLALDKFNLSSINHVIRNLNIYMDMEEHFNKILASVIYVR